MGRQNKVYRIHKAINEGRVKDAVKILDEQANQRVIEELERISDIADKEGIVALPVIMRIKELKQE